MRYQRRKHILYRKNQNQTSPGPNTMNIREPGPFARDSINTDGLPFACVSRVSNSGGRANSHRRRTTSAVLRELTESAAAAAADDGGVSVVYVCGRVYGVRADDIAGTRRRTVTVRRGASPRAVG